MPVTWKEPTRVGDGLVLVEKQNANGKRPAFRIGAREPGAPGNPGLVSDWHTRESKFGSKTVKLELRTTELRAAEAADRDNLAHAAEHHAALFADGTDELDIEAYYKPLVLDGVLRVPLRKGETQVLSLIGGERRKIALAELPVGAEVCVEVVDHGVWVKPADESWGPRWKVRTVYVTANGSAASAESGAGLEDDDFVDDGDVAE